MQGWGRMVYSEGDSKQRKEYVGEWMGGKKHGKGTSIWTDGDRYEGELRDNKKYGRGWHPTTPLLCPCLDG